MCFLVLPFLILQLILFINTTCIVLTHYFRDTRLLSYYYVYILHNRFFNTMTVLSQMNLRTCSASDNDCCRSIHLLAFDHIIGGILLSSQSLFFLIYHVAARILNNAELATMPHPLNLKINAYLFISALFSMLINSQYCTYLEIIMPAQLGQSYLSLKVA